MRGGPGIDESSHLPEDVGRECAAGEKDISAAAHDEIIADLEDEDVRGGSADGDAVAGSREVDIGAPFVHARRKGHPSDEAGSDVDERCIGRCATSSVGVRRLPVADGGRQHGWRWRRVVRSEAEADHLRGGGVDGTDSGRQIKAS